MSGIIIRNSARCLSCGDEIESKHRHDFVTCSCGALSVDGGTAYLRRAAMEPGVCEETSLIVEADEEPRTRTLEHSGIKMVGVHHSMKCTGRPCPIHNRSDHPLRAWAQVWHDGHVMRVDPGTGEHVIDPDEPEAMTVQNIESGDLPDPQHPDWHPDLPEGETDTEYHGAEGT